jgi:hypothetical protein
MEKKSRRSDPSKDKSFSLIPIFEKSGHTQKTFCREHRLAYSTFQYWLKKFRNKEITKVNNGLGAFGFANGGKTVIIEYAGRSDELCLAAGKYLKFCQKLNAGAALIGMTVTYYDGRVNNEWKNHHTADLLIGASMMFLTGPVGWVIGGAYFVTDIGFQCVYKKGITEYYLD